MLIVGFLVGLIWAAVCDRNKCADCEVHRWFQTQQMAIDDD